MNKKSPILTSAICIAIGLCVACLYFHPGWFLTVLFGPRYRTPLEQASAQLQSGMDRAKVDRLFAKFEPKEFKDEQWQRIAGFMYANLFNTNSEPALRVEYQPKGTSILQRVENCDVYFDTNGIIIGFRYSAS